VKTSRRAEAKGIVQRWNEQLAASRDMLWSPTIRAALITPGATMTVRAPRQPFRCDPADARRCPCDDTLHYITLHYIEVL
jgi:hypothetical protein